MTDVRNPPTPLALQSPAGMRAELNRNGSLRRLDAGAVSVALFIGNELEGGLANLYLRLAGDAAAWTPLLGPRSPTRFRPPGEPASVTGWGHWRGIDYALTLRLSATAPAWFWHIRLCNRGDSAVDVDLTYAQDLALAPYGAVRMNEFYVSQYVDHVALEDSGHGFVLASRQNQAVDGRYPWSMIGSLRRAAGYATDALQFHSSAARADLPPPGLLADLPARRLQHEHSMVVLRDERCRLAPGSASDAGFFGLCIADHPDATGESDLTRVPDIMALPESRPAAEYPGSIGPADPDAPAGVSLFASAPALTAIPLDGAGLERQFAPPWRHIERDARGELLSFFHGDDRHVVLAAKELQVLRPHGHLLRSGCHLTPDEAAMTSTAWMGGVFHSMLTQGHVSINRIFSTARTYLGLFRSHGVRVFVELEGHWQLLQLPSAFEIQARECRWIYRTRHSLISVRAHAGDDPRRMGLSLAVEQGPALRFLVSHHVALNDDDGSRPGSVLWRRTAQGVTLRPVPDSELGRRFPQGSFDMEVGEAALDAVGGDELLFGDGASRAQPYVCLVTAAAARVELTYCAGLVAPASAERPLYGASERDLRPVLQLYPPAGAPRAEPVSRFAEMLPWLAHNAWVHYLSPRGLEQYSGGGWGTRDVCQGPVELLLALERTPPVRDLLLRVLAMQNPDGDWPQWFMFFERERGIRAGDSHGDIVFWPLLVLGQYLLASGDIALLEQPVGFFDARGPHAGEQGSVWEHVRRALEVIGRRVVPGTALAAYGHGDWNDALQPADPRLRERLCSAWTVTLHHQTLTTLASALQAAPGYEAQAQQLTSSARAVREDFQRILLGEGVLAGYALFEEEGVRLLLHPLDGRTGVHYSSLAMVHAILEDMLSPEQSREHVRLIEQHLSGPDGLRLFDRPLAYRGGPQRLFQRAESATYFGREIGLMYMHAHLRYAQALAHMGDAERFFRALCQAMPIGLRSAVPGAALRQSNCYYSSSDATFADRYEASAHYERVTRGEIALEGGWRVYSSGAGITVGLIMRRFLGLNVEANEVCIDPVIPPDLDGLRATVEMLGSPVEITYRLGARGCGVSALQLDGRPVAFTPDRNPHRTGAARVAKSALGLTGGGPVRRLLVQTG